MLIVKGTICKYKAGLFFVCLGFFGVRIQLEKHVYGIKM